MTISTAAASCDRVCLFKSKTRHLSTGTASLASATSNPIVEKDILRVGTWHCCDENGDRTAWTVDRNTLQRIKDNFYLAKQRGDKNPCPWQDGHRAKSSDRIGKVRDLFVKGDTLFARCEVTSRKFMSAYGEKGDTTDEEVSVGVRSAWKDGNGNVYKDYLYHLANELNPIVPGQNPFVRLMSNESLVERKVFHMAEETIVDSTATTGTYSTADDATEWNGLDVIKLLSETLGISVNPKVNTFREFQIAMESAGGAMDATPSKEDVVTEPVPVETPEDVTLSHSRAIQPKKLVGRIGSHQDSKLESLVYRLSANVESLTKRLDANQKNEAKSSYHSEVDRLISANAITPADGANLKSEADKAGVYLMSHLGIVGSRAKGGAVPVGGRGAKLLAANAPREDADNTDAERQKAAGERLMAAMGLRN